MKLFTSLLLIFFIATFSSCESYRQTDGEVANGTPSRADTVLPHKYPPMQEAKHQQLKSHPVFLKDDFPAYFYDIIK